MKNKIIPYNPKLKEYARQLRKNATLAEVLLWQKIKNRALGVQFHRQVPMLEYIVDFYCHEIQLAVEIDGNSHEYRYEYDINRQGVLEKHGVEFIRFSDHDVKKNIFSVGLSLEEKVGELLEIRVPKDTPLTPPSRGESFREPSLQYEKVGTRNRTAKQPMKTPPYPHFDKLSASPKGGNGFGKKEKLKSKKLIDRLFAEGKSISKFPIKLIYLKTDLPEDVPIQAGVTVPKKNFKSAVKRNRVKRLLRESYRLNKQFVFNNSEATFPFLFLYLGKDIPLYIKVEKSMKEVLRKFFETEVKKNREKREKNKD